MSMSAMTDRPSADMREHGAVDGKEKLMVILEHDGAKYVPLEDYESLREFLCGYLNEAQELRRKHRELIADMYDALIANHGGYVTVMTLEGFEERIRDLGIGIRP